MIHPATELRFIDPRIGYGVVARHRIPKGTITWVHDELDQKFSLDYVASLPKLFERDIFKYAYIDGSGQYVLCWDIGRFVNHSCHPTCMAPGYDFEIALRDIEVGEELTGDYTTYNLEHGFECFCGSTHCRKHIDPRDRERLAAQWDVQCRDAFRLLNRVEQPLWTLVREKDEVVQALADLTLLPSCREHFCDAGPAFLQARQSA